MWDGYRARHDQGLLQSVLADPSTERMFRGRRGGTSKWEMSTVLHLSCNLR
jgi:hypothetical protein